MKILKNLLDKYITSVVLFYYFLFYILIMNTDLDNFTIFRRLIHTSNSDINSLSKINDIIIKLIEENNTFRPLEI